jgi:hypothetical protein
MRRHQESLTLTCVFAVSTGASTEIFDQSWDAGLSRPSDLNEIGLDTVPNQSGSNSKTD